MLEKIYKIMKKFRKSDYFKPIEDCCREQDENGVSEYLTMIAISRMKTEVFTEKELQEEMHKVIVNDALGSLVDKGLVKAVWDEENNDMAFYPA